MSHTKGDIPQPLHFKVRRKEPSVLQSIEKIRKLWMEQGMQWGLWKSEGLPILSSSTIQARGGRASLHLPRHYPRCGKLGPGTNTEEWTPPCLLSEQSTGDGREKLQRDREVCLLFGGSLKETKTLFPISQNRGPHQPVTEAGPRRYIQIREVSKVDSETRGSYDWIPSLVRKKAISLGRFFFPRKLKSINEIKENYTIARRKTSNTTL